MTDERLIRMIMFRGTYITSLHDRCCLDSVTARHESERDRKISNYNSDKLSAEK